MGCVSATARDPVTGEVEVIAAPTHVLLSFESEKLRAVQKAAMVSQADTNTTLPSVSETDQASVASSLSTTEFGSAPVCEDQRLGTSVNHIALICRDIGLSSYWYTHVIGFRQIQRPNFDRHGAWLSMGNVQLHLIKGSPHTCRGQHADDLIVSHIALDMADPEAVLSRLRQLHEDKSVNLDWRQNISVPNLETSQHARFESHTSADGKLTQFFVEDPDGYWLELCNCSEHDVNHGDVSPAGQGCHGHFNFPQLARMILRTLRWIRRARQRLEAEEVARELALLVPVEAEDVNSLKLQFLDSRRKTYGDICQGFSHLELKAALARAGNHVPGAILILKSLQPEEGQVYQPPNFLDNLGKIHQTKAFHMSSSTTAAAF
eukprot:TRINITY_DN7010_c2_g1_i1.p1 TRINITY_DN7010_c2_g1~~TRINITY_DN7010_c2_g1_i1.p1  ORF type:complete len:377 (+),score=69.20 TRINITY_DN7010_c2_g1_i1:56-1186(+)